MRIGILGCGFIGSTIASAVELMEGVGEISLLDADYESAVRLGSKLLRARIFRPDQMEEFIEASDLVVESASQQAVVEFVPRIIESGKDVMILSVGALVDDVLWEGLKAKAKERRCEIYIPSGAVAGIDGITSGNIADIECVTLTVIKPPAGVSLPPSLHEKSDELKDMKGPVTLFEGSAREAVKLFPKNVNVAATIALAGIGFDRTMVRIIVDPNVTRNQHKVEVRGRFGEMKIQMLNQPSTTNPRTSYLAPLSAISAIKKIITGIHLGN